MPIWPISVSSRPTMLAPGTLNTLMCQTTPSTSTTTASAKATDVYGNRRSRPIVVTLLIGCFVDDVTS